VVTTAAWAGKTAAWAVNRKAERLEPAWVEPVAQSRVAVRAELDPVAWLVVVSAASPEEGWRAVAWQAPPVLSRRATPRHPKYSSAFCPARQKYLRLRRPERALRWRSSTPPKIN
jgi:hypothetical protein